MCICLRGRTDVHVRESQIVFVNNMTKYNSKVVLHFMGSQILTLLHFFND